MERELWQVVEMEPWQVVEKEPWQLLVVEKEILISHAGERETDLADGTHLVREGEPENCDLTQRLEIAGGKTLAERETGIALKMRGVEREPRIAGILGLKRGGAWAEGGAGTRAPFASHLAAFDSHRGRQ